MGLIEARKSHRQQGYISTSVLKSYYLQRIFSQEYIILLKNSSLSLGIKYSDNYIMWQRPQNSVELLPIQQILSRCKQNRCYKTSYVVMVNRMMHILLSIECATDNFLRSNQQFSILYCSSWILSAKAHCWFTTPSSRQARFFW